MIKSRIIARLDVKGPNLIKGIHLEGLRVMGDPQEFATGYYQDGIDEIIYMDVVASLYGRNNLSHIVEHTARDVFVPITVGGGIRSVEDARGALRSGADKVAINTAAINRPELITEIAKHFGNQCVILSIEAKHMGGDKWQCFTDNGREPTNLNVIEWAKRGAELGAGEILLTSIDQEGTRKGFDIALTKGVTQAVPIPVIISGGYANMDDFEAAVNGAGVSAVAIADALHFKRTTVFDIRNEAQKRGLNVRSL
jgi:cyclase